MAADAGAPVEVRDPGAITIQIERTCEELARTLDAIADRVNPGENGQAHGGPDASWGGADRPRSRRRSGNRRGNRRLGDLAQAEVGAAQMDVFAPAP